MAWGFPCALFRQCCGERLAAIKGRAPGGSDARHAVGQRRSPADRGWRVRGSPSWVTRVPSHPTAVISPFSADVAAAAESPEIGPVHLAVEITLDSAPVDEYQRGNAGGRI